MRLKEVCQFTNERSKLDALIAEGIADERVPA
jgi:hypothetical protein